MTKIILACFCLTGLFAMPAWAADWSTTTIDSTDDVGYYSSLAMDSNEKAHIAYFDNTNSSLKYATNASGSWETSTVDSTHTVALSIISLALDQNDKVHIAYRDDSTDDLLYATNALGSWALTTVDSANDTGYYASLAIDSNDKVHIAYYENTSWILKYATNATGSWVTQTLDSTPLSGFSSDIVLDSNDKVYVTYYCLGDTLNLVTNASGSWVESTIQSGDYDYNVSLTIDADDNLYVSYYNNATEDLEYATNASGSWVSTSLDTNGDVGIYNNIVADEEGNVYIAYYDNTNDDLKYATNASGSWALTTLDSADSVGLHPSITLDANNRSHVSYWDFTNVDLKYIYTVGPSAPSVAIYSESEYVASRNVSLVLSAAGDPEQMLISEYSDFSGAAWEDYAATKDITLSAADGAKTIYAKFRDQWYAETDAAEDTITLDTTGPTVSASVSAGTYSSVKKAVLTADDGNGAGSDTIYYTANGKQPTVSSSVYSSAIVLTRNTTLKYYAVDHLGNAGTMRSEKYYITKAKFVTKKARANEARIKSKNTKYYANDLSFYLAKYPAKMKKHKYYIEAQRKKKYPDNYSEASRLALKKYWSIDSNLYAYNTLSYSANVKMTFSYTQKEYKALKKNNSGLKESELRLKFYDTETKDWSNFPDQALNTKNNTIAITNHFLSPELLFAIGK